MPSDRPRRNPFAARPDAPPVELEHLTKSLGPAKPTRDEALAPACQACRDPRGTCFPGPCQAHQARESTLTRERWVADKAMRGRW